MNPIFLKIFNNFSFLFSNKSIDFEQLKLILDVKLATDNRRSRTNLKGETVLDAKNGFLKTLLITFLISMGIAYLVFVIESPFVAYSIFSAYILFMLVMQLITDFSQVILDSSDSQILLPRPVSSQTLFMARLIHIIFYLFQLTLASALPGILVTAYLYGSLPAFVLFISVLLIVLFGVFLTNIIYLIVMRFYSEEKLRNIINIFQIGITIVIMGGYRIVGRFFDFESITNNLHNNFEFWQYSQPPFWVGAIMESIISKQYFLSTCICAFLLVLVPIFCFFVIMSKLSTSFSGSVGKIDHVTKKGIREYKPNKLFSQISKWSTQNPTEQSAFEFVWKMTGNDRKFKLRTYPSIVYFSVFIPLMFLTGGSRSLAEKWEDFKNSKSSLFQLIYFSGLVLNILKTNVVFYDQPKASWVYGQSPIGYPGDILLGQTKVFVLKYYFPFFVLLLTFGSIIWGIGYIDDIFFGGISMIILQFALILGFKNSLPFSKEFEKNSTGSFFIVFLQMLLVSIIGFAHYFISHVSNVILCGIPFLVLMLWFLMQEVRKLSWKKIVL